MKSTMLRAKGARWCKTWLLPTREVHSGSRQAVWSRGFFCCEPTALGVNLCLGFPESNVNIWFSLIAFGREGLSFPFPFWLPIPVPDGSQGRHAMGVLNH